MSKPGQLWIRLLAGLGVEGDAHSGASVKHRSRVARDATQPNLRQVHLIHHELLDELALQGFSVAPDGSLIRRAGIMSIVLVGGDVRAGDSIAVELPSAPHRPLVPV
jgi:hypothetical protein